MSTVHFLLIITDLFLALRVYFSAAQLLWPKLLEQPQRRNIVWEYTNLLRYATCLTRSSASHKKIFLQQIQGQVGLLFTDTEPQEVIDWFADFSQPDFARAGNVATRTIILPAGPVMRVYSDPPEPFPHNEEPQLRKLGLTTTMNRGVPTLTNPHKLCEKGKVLTAEQAQLLKLIGEKMVTFRVGLIARWEAGSGEVIEMDGPRLSEQGKSAEAGDDGDEAMSD